MTTTEINPRLILIGAIVLIALASLSTLYYSIPAESKGVVTRFGEYLKTADPGLRFKLPFGIDRVERVQVARQMKQEFGFGSTGATNPTQFSAPSEWEGERNMITGDQNEASVEWIIQYKIEAPKDYLFNVSGPAETLRDISESVMREVVGDRTVDEVLTVGREEIGRQVLESLQTLANRYGLGLRIEQVQLINVNPPASVKNSFNEVNQAKQDRERVINVARGEYNKEVPRASGEADQLISAAEGYAKQRINEAEGDAGRFNALFREYQKAPEVTKRRLYLETLGDVLPKLGKKIIMDSEGQQVLPLLQLPGQSN